MSFLRRWFATHTPPIDWSAGSYVVSSDCLDLQSAIRAAIYQITEEETHKLLPDIKEFNNKYPRVTLEPFTKAQGKALQRVAEELEQMGYEKFMEKWT